MTPLCGSARAVSDHSALPTSGVVEAVTTEVRFRNTPLFLPVETSASAGLTLRAPPSAQIAQHDVLRQHHIGD